MKKFLSLSYNRSAVLTATAATFALLGTVGISSAKKGGGGKPGGGEDPPPPPPPLGELPQISPNAIEYEARFFDAANPDDWGQSDVPTWSTDPQISLEFHDINCNGFAVGLAYAPSMSTAYAIMATPLEGILLFDSVFAPSLATTGFEGLRVRRASEINADGFIACSLVHTDESGEWVAVGNINDGRSLRILDGPLTRTVGALVSDLNEAGDVLATESILTGKKYPNLRFNNWLYLASAISETGPSYDDPAVLLPDVDASDLTVQFNTSPLQVAYSNYSDPDSAVYRLDILNDVTTTIPDGNRGIVHIDEDGSVYTFVRTQAPDRRRGIEEQGYPARWSEAFGIQPLAEIQVAGSWLEVIDVSAGIPVEGDPIEVLMGRGIGNYSQLEIYRPDSYPGTRYPLEVIGGEFELWNSLIVNETSAISRPDLTGHGYICGQGYDGTAYTRRLGFILIPIAQ